jgi:hypothetical protein
MSDDEEREKEHKRLDPKLLNLIGVAASSWASLELVINMTIWDLAEVPPAIGACITTQIFTIDGRLKALLALMKLRKFSKKLIDDINKFAEEIRGPSHLRNRLVHDAWGTTFEDRKTQRIWLTADRKLRFEYQPVDLEDIKRDVDKIIDAVKQFPPLRERLMAELPTLLEIPPTELHPIFEVPRPPT